jgi:NADPH:quinone reductase-like Zn-dependent oxidoreductase
MLAARIHSFGSPISLDNIPIPAPGADQVMVKVAATSFNPTEMAVRAGVLPVALPFTLGWDLAGTVDGSPVVGMLSGGAAAEYTVGSDLVPAPKTIPLVEAAALPLAGMTAWQAVFEHGRVSPGQRVLVNGAGGGIGGFTVQLAKHAGAHVIATASPRSAPTVLSQGADEVIDYRTPFTLDAPVDLVLNITGFAPAQARALVPSIRGPVIDVSAPFEPHPDVEARHFVTRNDPADLAALIELVDNGQVAVDVTATYPLTSIMAVHELGAAGGIRGKVVIVP